MATYSGSYRETAIASIVDLDANIDAFFTASDTRLQALPGGATFTLATGALTINMLANDGAGVTFTHKVTQAISIPSIGDSVTLITGLAAYLVIILAESRYDTFEDAELSMSISIGN